MLPLSSWIYGLRSTKIHRSVAVTPAPVRVPSQQPLVPSFTSVVGQAENFSPCPMLPPMPILVVLLRHQLLSGSLPCRLSRDSRRLDREVLTLPCIYALCSTDTTIISSKVKLGYQFPKYFPFHNLSLSLTSTL